jgi:SOS-response transcriptional repressor LexA
VDALASNVTGTPTAIGESLDAVNVATGKADTISTCSKALKETAVKTSAANTPRNVRIIELAPITRVNVGGTIAIRMREVLFMSPR